MALLDDEQAEKWLALREKDPAAFAALPAKAQDLAQLHADMVKARARQPLREVAPDKRADAMLALRDSKFESDRKRFAALPDRVRDQLGLYEDVKENAK